MYDKQVGDYVNKPDLSVSIAVHDRLNFLKH